MSQAIKALTRLSIQATPKYGYLRYLCYGKDLVKSTTASSPDFLLQNLKNSQNPQSVLKIVNEHYSIMNSRHIMQALRSLFDLQKIGRSEITTKDILRHPDFDKICKKLKSQAGLIEINETIEALKIISYIGAPSNSTIVQVLLQLIRQNINFLSLHQIMFLEFLVSQFKSCPLVEALKIALTLVFEIHLPKKMDRNNLSHLSEFLYFASRTTVSDKTIELIIEALCQINEEFDAKTAKSIIWSLTELPSNKAFEPLLNKAINDLLVHIDDLTYMDMESTLSKLVQKYTKRFSFFYNEVYFDTCANYIIDHDLGFKDSVYTLRKLGRMTHVNKNLLDYVSKKIYEDPEIISNADPADIYSLAISISLTDYRPHHWDNLKNLIMKKKNLALENRREIIWIRFAASLCLLDIYKIDVLTRALKPEYLEALLRKRFMSDFENYFVICHCMKLNRPELLDIIPAKFEPEQIVDLLIVSHQDFPLEASLQKALGENYVMSNLFSKMGHQIDHAILFRKGGYPVAITDSNIKFIENIEIPSGGELLLIMGLKHFNYTINTKQIKESISVSIRMLECNGYNVLPINIDVWESLNDFEKIPYLMQEVKNKVSSEIAVSELNAT